MLRTIIGIIAGDLIFAGLTVLMFTLAKVDPHMVSGSGFMLSSIAGGIVFALLGGFVGGLIGRRADILVGIFLGLIIAVGAAVSLLARPGGGAVWTQTAALILMAPAAVLGDSLRKSRQQLSS